MIFANLKHPTRAHGILVVLLGVMLMAGGCQSPTVTHDQAQSVLLSRMGLRQQLNLTGGQLDTTVTALNAINGKQADDLVAAYTKFGDEVGALEKSVAQLNDACTGSSQLANAYFDTAATKIALIQDAQLKSRATSRRQKAVDLAATSSTDMRSVELAYRLFVQRLRDIQAYLAADLTSGSVRSIQDQIAQTNADVAPLKAKSDQLADDLELGNELMNTGDLMPATTTAPTTLQTP
jgi:hypothetical protein